MFFFRFAFNKINPSLLIYKKAIFNSQFGKSEINFAEKRVTHKDGWQIALMAKEKYELTFENGPALTNISFRAGFYEFEVS